MLGGDRSIALPELRAAVRGPLALVQFDSHPDTWNFYFGQKHTHGTPFRRAVEEGLLDPSRSIQGGMCGSIYDKGDWGDAGETGFALVPTDEVRELGIGETVARVRARRRRQGLRLLRRGLRGPHVRAGDGDAGDWGLRASREAQEFVRGLVGLNIVGYDVVEVYPQYDGPGQVTALLAANISTSS